MSKELLTRLLVATAEGVPTTFGFLNSCAFVYYTDSSGRRSYKENPRLNTRVISEKNIDGVEVSEVENTINMPTWQAQWFEKRRIGITAPGEPEVGLWVRQLDENERWEYCQFKRFRFTGNTKNFRRWITPILTDFGESFECLPIIKKALTENDNEFWKELIDSYSVKG